jgi:crotonobetainyl-CoA:carnitine CoA-transferase CaiB-like acyl-CoA transferase
MYAVTGILTALYQRKTTGRGQYIDISMFETAVSWLGYYPHHYWHRGEEPVRVGLRHHYVTPYGPFLASDKKYVGVAVASASDWEIFCRQVIERADLLDDARFKTAEARRKNRNELESLIEKSFLEHPSAEWKRRLEQARLPYGSVNNIAEVLAHPQLIARNMIQEIDSPVGPVPVLASPLRLSDSPQRLDPLPVLG